MTIPSNSFMEGAACSIESAEVFFIDGMQDMARYLCNRCPVIVECAEWAIPQGGLEGIFAGMTAHQRSEARQRRGIISVMNEETLAS